MWRIDRHYGAASGILTLNLLALLSLADDDRELINALFFDGVSTRKYAERVGITQRAVIKRRDRILLDLKIATPANHLSERDLFSRKCRKDPMCSGAWDL